MPEPTIDLSRGLQIWYDFGPNYYDAQRNRLQDRSGYGRHAVANGGPSLADSGPQGFGAAVFDGSDDYFEAPVYAETDGPFTDFVLFEVNNFDTDYGLVSNGTSGGSGSELKHQGGNLVFKFGTDDNETHNMSTTITENEWYFGLVTYDEEEVTLYKGVDPSETFAPPADIVPGDANYTVGKWSGGSTNYMDGRIASVGRWHRALNRAEIEYLNAMSGPRRSIV